MEAHCVRVELMDGSEVVTVPKAPAKRKTAEYVPVIKRGVPIPARAKGRYTERISEGKLIEIAQRIQVSDCVHLPNGSVGKFRNLLKARGLKIRKVLDGPEPRARVWVIPADSDH